MRQHPPSQPSVAPVTGNPRSVWEQINKFGTYEVQDTQNSGASSPAIGTGLPKTEVSRHRNEKTTERRRKKR